MQIYTSNTYRNKYKFLTSLIEEMCEICSSHGAEYYDGRGEAVSTTPHSVNSRNTAIFKNIGCLTFTVQGKKSKRYDDVIMMEYKKNGMIIL